MFKQRSNQKELLDETEIPRELLHQNLRELEFINKWLGGIAISIKGLNTASSNHAKICVADIGCGGGDALAGFAKHYRNKNESTQFVGIDLKTDCIEFAQKTCVAFPEIDFIQEDYRTAIEKLPEITHVHAALFCHHLTDNEIVELIKFCQKHRVTLVINDLERNPLAYWSIWALTRLFGGSSLVKNDAPLSVLRGIKKREWKALIEKANAKNYKISWQWAFRHLIIIAPYDN